MFTLGGMAVLPNYVNADDAGGGAGGGNSDTTETYG
jgi:hypothetical protein